MRDETSLGRLAELGVDVYVPRAARHAGVTAPAAAPAAGAQAAPAPAAGTFAVALFAADAAQSSALITDVVRALAFAHIACVRVDVDAEAALASAAAVIVFGEAEARRVGALLPAQRQREIGWVVTGEPGALRGDAPARRALWSELKRIARGLAPRDYPARR